MTAVARGRCAFFFLLAGGGAALDLLTKRWAFQRFGLPGEQAGPWWIVPDVFGFQTSLNEGALFGLGQGMVPVFALFSVAAATGILYWLFGMGGAADRTLTTALGLVTGGVFGNLYDRLGLPGLAWNYDSPLHKIGEPVYAVRDWILVMIGRWPWPTFNIADSLLVCGAALLMWHAFRYRPEEPAR